MSTADNEPQSQAKRVFAKFGGVPSLHRALEALGAEHARNIVTIYRWDYPRAAGGCDGVIPSLSMKSVLKAARYEGVLLTPDDLDPRPL